MMKSAPIFGKVSVESLRNRQRIRYQERAKKDLQQNVFSLTEAQEVAVKGNPHKFAVISEKGIDPFRKTTCPFCLSYNRLNRFLISTKKGFDRGRGECPICGQGMKLATLVNMEKWTVTEYAAFVFAYRQSGFWQKIDFATWSKHLKMMGWNQPFWDEYKRLKGDLPEADAEQQKKDDEAWAGYEESMKNEQ
jgi:transcription elongation factor Elf1